MKTQGGWFSLSYFQDLGNETGPELSELGGDGWELVSVMPLDMPGITSGTRSAIAFFKRPGPGIDGQ
jgi:hypothetical protein